jgi:hypothetical protein
MTQTVALQTLLLVQRSIKHAQPGGFRVTNRIILHKTDSCRDAPETQVVSDVYQTQRSPPQRQTTGTWRAACDKSGAVGAEQCMSSRVDVMHGSQPRRGLGRGSGVGPALHPDEPGPYRCPSDNCLEFGALPTAVACARLHARNLLWEWGLDWLAPDVELLVGGLMDHAVTATVVRDEAAVRLRLSSDGTRVLIEVWDADPWPPIVAERGGQARPSRGARARAAPSGGPERTLGLVSHQGTERQSGLVRDSGVIGVDRVVAHPMALGCFGRGCRRQDDRHGHALPSCARPCRGI